MAAPLTKPPLAEAKNGVVAPLYFDRQIVRAEDLTLDRASHDHELARMRRLLHGWGVVAGLIPMVTGTVLKISAGYGITRTGEEVYLTEAIEIPNIVGRVWSCCGPEEPTCEIIDPEERERIARERELTQVTSWLIARPTQSESDLRPGIPAGCAHPANKLMPTRACDVVSIELLCALPPEFEVPRPVCKNLMPYFCTEPPAMLAMPPIPTPEQNILILGRIVAGIETASFQPIDRRAVLPVSMLQNWLQSCVCPLLAEEPREPPPPTREPEPGRPDPGGTGPRVPFDPEIEIPRDPEVVIPVDPDVFGPREPIDPLGPRVDPGGLGLGPEINPEILPGGLEITPRGPKVGPGALGWTEFGRVLEGNGFAPAAAGQPPAGPIARASGPEVTARAETARALEEAGVAGPEVFLAADREAMAATLNRPIVEVEAMARELEGFRPFFTTPML